MGRKLKAAVVQMDVVSAPVPDRLDRAASGDHKSYQKMNVNGDKRWPANSFHF